MATRANYPSRQELVGAQLTQTDSTNKITLVAADANVERKLEVMSFQTTNASNTIVALFLNDGSNDFKVGEIIVYAQAGDADNTPVANGLDAGFLPWLPYDAGNCYIPMPKGVALKIALNSALGSGKTLDAMAILTRYDQDA